MPSKRVPHLATVRVDEAAGTGPAKAQNASVSACTFARRLLDAGRPEDAMRILDGAIEDGKDSLEFQFLLGRAAFRLGDQAHAHRAFSRAIALSPQEAEVYRWLGRLLTRKHNLGAKRGGERTVRSSAAPKPQAEPLAAAMPSPFEDEPDTEIIPREPLDLSTKTGERRSR